VLAPGGELSNAHPGFEDRPGQREMLRLVSERLNEGGVLVVEAGTGIGKSLAYLIPAVRWALANGERTVVSTNTIHLQEQLVGKDLPLVRRLLGEEVSWVLVKGRGNYVSIRRALLAAEGAPTLFEDDRRRELDTLVRWLDSTGDGSLADLPFVPSDEVWDEVRSDPDACLRTRCPHFGQCFYQRSRRRAAEANLLVVNHHLLFTDLSVRRATGNYTQSAVLPPFKHLVLDEAHNVEDAATSHLGVEVTRSGLFRLLARLDRRGKGLLGTIDDALGGGGAAGSELRRRVEEKMRPALEEARSALGALVEALEPLACEDAGAVRLGGGGLREPLEDAWTREVLEGVLLSFQKLEREARGLRRALAADEGLADKLEGRLLDLQSVERRLAAATHALRLVLDPAEGGDGFVRWLETRGRGRQANLSLAAAPIEPGPLLREGLFSRLETTVLTSATLTTRRSFEFLRRRLGLAPEDLAALERPLVVREAALASPFDFERQTLLVVPTDLPEAGGGAASAELGEQTARVMRELAELTGGGLFGLFTSHRALRAVAERLRQQGTEARWPLFVHGEDARARLLEGFVRSGRGILLGTASFWEGVDVPGWPLRGLVIQKLPFRVPTEPVTAARIEALEREGRDAFQELMLPLAALRLKQGFGRLVRTREDRGAVVLLDDRILRKRYGRYLRDSLPPAPLVKGAWAELRRPLRAFYGADEAPG
jgi:ATP-dependent DNA helicase DinG